MSDLANIDRVALERTDFPSTPDEFLWDVIKDRTAALSFTRYSDFIDRVLSDAGTPAQSPKGRVLGTAHVLSGGLHVADIVAVLVEHPDVQADSDLNDRIREAGRIVGDISVPQEERNEAAEFLRQQYEARIGPVPATVGDALAQQPLGTESRPPWDTASGDLKARLRTFGAFNGDAYQLLKAATEFFVYAEAGRLEDVGAFSPPTSYLPAKTATSTLDFMDRFRKQYLVDLGTEPNSPYVLPYLDIIRRRLGELPFKQGLQLGVASESYGILRSRLVSPILLELIWNYWIEQGLMVQTINLVSLRFQNVRRGPGVDPLATLEIDPLRPLSNLLWGYLQDEINRLSVNRRSYEYAHGLGLQLVGKAVPEMHPADVRTQFLPAFHDLLRLAWTFFREDDDKTIVADAFPLLNALRELHFVISEGAHNQFGDLPMRARIEMLMQQWILGRPEMRDFLRGRTMVPYPESWMDRVDAMKALQGWNDASVINYADLAAFGEQVVLSVRYGSWSTTTDQNQAANWARAWRPAIQRYTHALRIVSGIDISVGDVAEVRTGSERVAQGMVAGRAPTPGGTFNFPAAPAQRQLGPRPGADKLLRPAQQPAAAPGWSRTEGPPRR